MNGSVVASPTHPYFSLQEAVPALSAPAPSAPAPSIPAPSAPALSDDDRGEIGRTLAELLAELNWAGALRPRTAEGAAGVRLDLPLTVPGTGDVVAHVTRVDGTYELSVSGGPWEGMVVLREADGRLAELYRQHFSSQAEQEQRAKERLMRGLHQLMLVKDWGIRHYHYV